MILERASVRRGLNHSTMSEMDRNSLSLLLPLESGNRSKVFQKPPASPKDAEHTEREGRKDGKA